MKKINIKFSPGELYDFFLVGRLACLVGELEQLFVSVASISSSAEKQKNQCQL